MQSCDGARAETLRSSVRCPSAHRTRLGEIRKTPRGNDHESFEHERRTGPGARGQVDRRFDRTRALAPWLARAGLVARGAIYAIIGVLALEVAFGSGGKTTNQKTALAEIAQQSGGKILLVLMAIGLFGYAFDCCAAPTATARRRPTTRKSG